MLLFASAARSSRPTVASPSRVRITRTPSRAFERAFQPARHRERDVSSRACRPDPWRHPRCRRGPASITIVRRLPAGARSISGGGFRRCAACDLVGSAAVAPPSTAPTTSITMPDRAAVARHVRRPERSEPRTQIDREDARSLAGTDCPGSARARWGGAARRRACRLRTGRSDVARPGSRYAASPARYRASGAPRCRAARSVPATRGARMSPISISREGFRSSTREPRQRRKRAR